MDQMFFNDQKLTDAANAAVFSLMFQKELVSATLVSAVTAALSTAQRDQIVAALVPVLLSKVPELSVYDVRDIVIKPHQESIVSEVWAKHGDELTAAVAQIAVKKIGHEPDYHWGELGVRAIYDKLKDDLAAAVKARVEADPKWLTDKLETMMVGKMLQACVEEHARKLVEEAKKSVAQAQADAG